MKNKRKMISKRMLLFEFRNVTRNPYVHIFGVGMPVLMMVIITRAVLGEIVDREALLSVKTTIFLGIGAMIPMATIFMGYGVAHAQELEKGIPQRMELFGIGLRVSLCNRIVSEVIFMAIAFIIYFGVGYGVVGVKLPKLSGAVLYMICILAFSVILFCLAHAIAAMLRKFSLTYCVTMILYFGMMILGGMMGISFDSMPPALQAVARLLPVTYINKDFAAIWAGESYNFMPMLQSYLLLGAVAGILLFVTVKRGSRRLH